MTCLQCKHLRSGNLTRHGLNNCDLDKPYHSYPDTHTCSRFSRADDVQIAKRMAWVSKCK